MTRQDIADGLAAYARTCVPNRELLAGDVVLIDSLADALWRRVEARSGLRPSKAACQLMHEFEGCLLEAYPDPGSRDGHPWTIGFGSTGPGIHRGVKWTRQQAEERFEADLAKFGERVAELIGDAPTKQHQFDAMVSLAYNIGVGAFAKSTVLRRHKAGDYHGASDAFAMWVRNDGAVMKGLVRRREAEAKLYRGESR